MKLSQASGVPYWRQIRDQLADQIRSGQLVEGAALPSVRQLAADLLVSVITTKKAYEELEAAGMVVSHQGRGTFVATTGVTASRNDLLATIESAVVSVARRAQDAGVTRPEWEAMVGRAWE